MNREQREVETSHTSYGVAPINEQREPTFTLEECVVVAKEFTGASNGPTIKMGHEILKLRAQLAAAEEQKRIALGGWELNMNLAHEAANQAELLRSRAERAEATKDGAYRERNQVVAWAAQMALALGYVVRVTTTVIDGWDAAWHNCVYIMTPLGQASWHFHDDDAAMFADLPRGEVVWDGHTTPEKYERLRMSRYWTPSSTPTGQGA